MEEFKEEILVENQEAKQNVAAMLLPIIGNKKSVADSLNIDPFVIDKWMESPSFLSKLFEKLDDCKDSVKARFQQQTIELINKVHEEYMNLLNKKDKLGIKPAMFKTFSQQYVELRKLLKLDHKDPVAIEERYEQSLMEELENLSKTDQDNVIKLLHEKVKLTDDKNLMLGNE